MQPHMAEDHYLMLITWATSERVEVATLSFTES